MQDTVTLVCLRATAVISFLTARPCSLGIPADARSSAVPSVHICDEVTADEEHRTEPQRASGNILYKSHRSFSKVDSYLQGLRLQIREGRLER